MFDRQNPLYALRPDLTQIIEERLDDLSHYPGGIMLEEIRGKRQEEPKFGLLLTNRQQSDTGKPVKQIFEETGLPVRS